MTRLPSDGVRRALLIVLLALASAGCSMGDDGVEETASAGEQAAACPAAWKPGWQLADDVGMRVYRPSWMPSLIDAEIGGQWNSDGVAVGRTAATRRLPHEERDVHVNFRGYRARPHPALRRDADVGREDAPPFGPCFSDPRARVRSTARR